MRVSTSEIIHDDKYTHRCVLGEKLRKLGQRASLVDCLVSEFRTPGKNNFAKGDLKLVNFDDGLKRSEIEKSQMYLGDGNHAVRLSCVCVIVQLYRWNAVVFDFCVENIQKFAADIGVTLIALVPADMYEEYSQRLSCSVEKYENDLGFNKNLAHFWSPWNSNTLF